MGRSCTRCWVCVQVLQEHQLLIKRVKCSFGKQEVGYLGHVISHEGVQVDQKKLRRLHSGLNRRQSVHWEDFGPVRLLPKIHTRYGVIAAPLTQLLKKALFSWNETSTEAFLALKKSLSESQVLALPDFTKDFFVEYVLREVVLGQFCSRKDILLHFLAER